MFDKCKSMFDIFQHLYEIFNIHEMRIATKIIFRIFYKQLCAIKLGFFKWNCSTVGHQS